MCTRYLYIIIIPYILWGIRNTMEATFLCIPFESTVTWKAVRLTLLSMEGHFTIIFLKSGNFDVYSLAPFKISFKNLGNPVDLTPLYNTK